MVCNPVDSSHIWSTEAELVLPHEVGKEWDAYHSSLLEAGMNVTEEPDHLVWAENTLMGSMSAELSYKFLMENLGFEVETGLRLLLWSDKLPIKIGCFIWLCMENKIMTWQNL